MPLNTLGNFIRSDGSPGSFQKLLAALPGANIRRIEPVEIIASDPTAPMGSKPRLKLKVTNVLNRPVKGTLHGSIEVLTLDPRSQSMVLASHESKEVFVTLAGGSAAPDNNYKLLAEFDAGTDGAKRHAELLHVNVIARRHITVDGNLDDWRDVIPPEEKAYLQYPAGTMPRFCAYFDTDYEFALNKVDTTFSGGTEIFCLQRPGMMRKHFFPRQPRAPVDGGPVKGKAKLVVKDSIVECAIPWSELPEVKARMEAGLTVKFSFRVNNGGTAFELAASRSVSKQNPLTFHNDWSTHRANEIEFGWEP